jgi:hypothetical protein
MATPISIIKDIPNAVGHWGRSKAQSRLAIAFLGRQCGHDSPAAARIFVDHLLRMNGHRSRFSKVFKLFRQQMEPWCEAA